MDEVVAGTEKDWGDGGHNTRKSRRWRWLGMGVVVAGMVAVKTYITIQFVGSTADSVAVSDAPLPSPPTEEVPEPTPSAAPTAWES